ncbi:MAG: hypothetical protein GWP10_19405 [Nitrospiraceae bacterium]|nr:hypothetical protein [Nitrospiraceae bacterium]
MIRDHTTGKTKFVQLLIDTPDMRAPNRLVGGLTKASAMFECKRYPDVFVMNIFDSEV